MAIIPIKAFIDNYIWVIADEEEGVFDCVDPGDAQPIIDFAQTSQLPLRAILLTHHHADHIGGVSDLVKNYPSCDVYGPCDVRISQKHHVVKEHQILSIGKNRFHILFNPGHTSSHISYYEPQHGWLFCGDTLFSAGCGRVFDGTIEQLHHSLDFFKSLAPDTQIFCAHEYTLKNLEFAQHVEPENQDIKNHMNTLKNHMNSCSLPSTLALELLINPFLRSGIPAVQQYAIAHGACSNSSLDVFKVLREQKNQFT